MKYRIYNKYEIRFTKYATDSLFISVKKDHILLMPIILKLIVVARKFLSNLPYSRIYLCSISQFYVKSFYLFYNVKF